MANHNLALYALAYIGFLGLLIAFFGMKIPTYLDEILNIPFWILILLYIVSFFKRKKKKKSLNT